MYKIIKAEKLNEIVYLMVVEAPMVAKHCQPGQFIIVKEDDAGERIPLTICDYDREAGTVTIVFQPIGASTEKFAKLQAGDSFEDFVGPLGCPSEFVHEGHRKKLKKKENGIRSRWCRYRTCLSAGKMASRAWYYCRRNPWFQNKGYGYS